MAKLPGHVNRMLGIGPGATHGGSVRVCPKRDAICPHGMHCPYWIDRYACHEDEHIQPLGRQFEAAIFDDVEALYETDDSGHWSDDKTYEEAPKGEAAAYSQLVTAARIRARGSKHRDMVMLRDLADAVTRQAAEIEALRERAHYAEGTAELAMKHRDRAENLLAEAVKVLEPFAEVAEDFDLDGRDLKDSDGIYANKAGDFRAARNLLAKINGENDAK